MKEPRKCQTLQNNTEKLKKPSMFIHRSIKNTSRNQKPQNLFTTHMQKYANRIREELKTVSTHTSQDCLKLLSFAKFKTMPCGRNYYCFSETVMGELNKCDSYDKVNHLIPQNSEDECD
jgi:hypothetical protein